MNCNDRAVWRNAVLKMAFLGELLLIPVIIAPVSCVGPLRLGGNFGDSYLKVKEGYHTKQDVVRIMGEPYARNIDPEGRLIYTYFWADGHGGGQKCIIVFNRKGEVMLKEVIP